MASFVKIAGLLVASHKNNFVVLKQSLKKNMFSLIPMCFSYFWCYIWVSCRYGWMIALGGVETFICSCDVLRKTMSPSNPEYSSFDFGKRNAALENHHTMFNTYIVFPGKLRYGWKMKCQFGMSYFEVSFTVSF